MLVLIVLQHVRQLPLIMVLLTVPSQSNSVELRLNLGLIDGQVSYLRLNELMVLSEEQTPANDHTLAELDLHHLKYLRE
jgi:hypothetical protein